jgi:hypothetical protein
MVGGSLGVRNSIGFFIFILFYFFRIFIGFCLMVLPPIEVEV